MLALVNYRHDLSSSITYSNESASSFPKTLNMNQNESIKAYYILLHVYRVTVMLTLHLSEMAQLADIIMYPNESL